MPFHKEHTPAELIERIDGDVTALANFFSQFDTITGAAPATLGLWSLIALYISVELARFATSFGEIWGDVTFRYTVGALLRRNIVASILRRPGALAPPVSSGEAVSRFVTMSGR